jgi:O-antigen/teichoic acid export membrane protein
MSEMSGSEVNDIKQKTAKGLLSLFSRSFLIYLLRAISILLLARFLDPKDYGVFGILNSWVWAVHLFLPDLSMFTALIQQKAEPTIKQLRNLFGVSLYRSLLIVILFVLFGQFILDYHSLPDSAFSMLVVLAMAIFFDGLKTPFRMGIERKLNFKAIVFIEVVETFFMYAAQIIAAYMGAGTWSFIIALLTRSIVGLLLYYYHERQVYLPIVYINEIKRLFNYEFMVQLKKILVGVKGLIVPLILGKLLSKNDLGIVVWTVGIASIPTILAHNYDRVLFPALSKLQENLSEFKNVASKGVEYSALGLGLLYCLIASNAEAGINIFFPDKWNDAIILLPFCCLAVFIGQVRFLGSSIMNASGRPKVLFYLEALAVIVEIGIAIPATIYGKGLGYIVALIGVEFLLCLIMLILNRKYFYKNTFYRLGTFAFAFVVTLTSCYYFINPFFNNLYASAIMSSLYVILIFMSVVLLLNKNLVHEIKRMKLFKRLF